MTISPFAASELDDHAIDKLVPIAFGDDVRVPDGRTGRVIGFYRREHASTLVHFASGESAEFFIPDVARLPD